MKLNILVRSGSFCFEDVFLLLMLSLIWLVHLTLKVIQNKDVKIKGRISNFINFCVNVLISIKIG